MANSNNARHGSLPTHSSLDSPSDEEYHTAHEDEHQQGQCDELGVILVFPDNLWWKLTLRIRFGWKTHCPGLEPYSCPMSTTLKLNIITQWHEMTINDMKISIYWGPIWQLQVKIHPLQRWQPTNKLNKYVIRSNFRSNDFICTQLSTISGSLMPNVKVYHNYQNQLERQTVTLRREILISGATRTGQQLTDWQPKCRSLQSK